MNSNGRSLRSLVDKWLAPTPGTPILLRRLRHAKQGSLRCVRVGAAGALQTWAILFFDTTTVRGVCFLLQLNGRLWHRT